MLHRFRHRIVIPVVILWLLLTISGIAVRVVVWKRLSRSLDASGDATYLEDALSELTSALQDADDSQRGYLLTGNEGYLEPFNDTKANLSADFKKLADTAHQDASLEKDLAALRDLVNLKMAELDETIKLRHDKGLKEALTEVNAGKGRESSEKIRKVMWRMRERRQNIFSSAWANTRQNLELLQRIGQAVGFLGLGAGIFALYLVRVSFVQERARWRLLEEKLRAEKIATEKTAYLADLSHELRTPMNAILGFGELLQGEKLTPRQAQYVHAIRSSGSGLLQLINDVLDLSKLEAGKLELHLEPADLREVGEFIRTMFAQQAAAKSLELRIAVDGLPRALLLDRLRLRQVLVNLVGNAIKFTAKGHVALRARWEPLAEDRSRGTLNIEVEDTGIGIPPEKHNEVFKPFVQAATQQQSQGTGLGLSIVKRLTLAMGGNVTLQSSPGEGAIFRLCFAEVAVSSRVPITDVLATGTQVDFNDFSPAKILVADDNKTNRELISGLFADSLHRLHFAANGQEALALIAEERPDLVLLDIRMPVLDGRATLADIRKRPELASLPVIAVSASTHADDDAHLAARFNGFMRKPFSRQALYQQLARFLPRSPRQPKLAPSTAAPPPAPLPSAQVTSADSRDAAAELLALHREKWPRLRDTLAINETLAFAQKIRHIGQTMQLQPLITYADRLAIEAETYAIKDLERTLAEFPLLIAPIEQRECLQ
ncbi:MAG TPA: ATP-binding protein [Verrucomicrobiae bacterium]|jgi:signal transduction histidine kinase/CheY-like chemotaxis protein|nr:ATP-binding protein [Verrucomicrobiae bacterium]